MRDDVPAIIREVGFDFHWDERKVWALDVPVETMAVADLAWHLDVPFLMVHGAYALTPRQVLEDPAAHPAEHARAMQADLRYPIDVMSNRGRFVILDGLHRLMKARALGIERVEVRKIPREAIPRIST